MNNRLWIHAICCVFLTVLVAGCASSGSDAQDVEKELFSQETLTSSAESALQDGNQEKALRIYQEIAIRYPKNKKAIIAAAELARQLEQYDLSAKYYEGLITSSPDDTDAKEALAEVNVKRMHLDEAEKQFQQLISEKKADWRSWNGLGMIADLRGDYKKSQVYYDKATALSPSNPELINNRGYSLIMAHKYAEAIEMLRDGLRLDPTDQRLHNNMIVALSWLGQYDDAVIEGHGIFPDWVVYNNVGYIAQLKGDYQTASKFYEKALSSSPRYYPKAAENLDIVNNLLKQHKQ